MVKEKQVISFCYECELLNKNGFNVFCGVIVVVFFIQIEVVKL